SRSGPWMRISSTLSVRSRRKARPCQPADGRAVAQEAPAAASGGRVLLFLSFLAVKLAIKGGRPYVLVDDNVLEQHDLGHYSGRSTKNSFRDWYTRQFLKHISFYRGYSEFITDEERERVDRDAVSLFKSQDFTINGINLWPAVESSLVRYYLSSAGLVQDEPDYEEMALSFIRNALLSYRIAINVRKKLKPD